MREKWQTKRWYTNEVQRHLEKNSSGVKSTVAKAAKKYQQEEYKYHAKILEKRKLITRFLVRNAGFRGIASGLEISINTVMKIIYKEAEILKEPAVPKGCVFEIDEMKAH